MDRIGEYWTRCAVLAAGLKVGRFTGPHLLNWNERFHLNGKPIGEDRIRRDHRWIAAEIEVEAAGEVTIGFEVERLRVEPKRVRRRRKPVGRLGLRHSRQPVDGRHLSG